MSCIGRAVIPPDFWADAGRTVASLHLVVGPWYGWSRDGWLGRLPQENPPTEDGYEFFADHHVLRYSAIERLCARLPDLGVPFSPMVTCGPATCWLVFIDPAVSWTWADIDLSMVFCTAPPEVADRFFGGYDEVRPLDAGCPRRMPVVHLRELLSTIAHEGDRWGAVDRVPTVTRSFEVER